MGRPKVALIIDGPDPDNYLALIAALSTFMCYDLVAVIMTGRPVSANMEVPAFAFNPEASRAVRRDNALHAKGILMRHGGAHVPVFCGGRAPFSTVPHKLHIHECVTDVYHDAYAGYRLAGDIDDAVAYLAQFELVHFICGGPMTDLSYLMTQPMLHNKLGIAVAQLGMFGFNDCVPATIAGGRRQFNTLADPGAAQNVLFNFPSPFYMIPTDITKDPDLAFHSADEFASLSSSYAAQEIAAMYAKAWPEMWGKMGIPAHAHDFHPAEFMHLLLKSNLAHRKNGRDRVGRYTVSPVSIKYVPHLPHEKDRWGEIDLGQSNSQAPRYVVDGCDNTQHRKVLRAVLNKVRGSENS